MHIIHNMHRTPKRAHTEQAIKSKMTKAHIRRLQMAGLVESSSDTHYTTIAVV